MPHPSSDHISSPDRICELLTAELTAVPPTERRRAAFRLASHSVEMAAYEVARSGDARQAPKLILLANSLLQQAED